MGHNWFHSNVFGSVTHIKKLINKIHTLGVRGVGLELFKDYLSDGR